MKRKLFLSAISSLPFIGYLFNKNPKDRTVYKIQFTTKESFGEYGKISVLFHGNDEVYQFKEEWTFDEFQKLAKCSINEPFSIGRNENNFVYVNKKSLWASDKMFL